jgi:hypothetical protein
MAGCHSARLVRCPIAAGGQTGRSSRCKTCTGRLAGGERAGKQDTMKVSQQLSAMATMTEARH